MYECLPAYLFVHYTYPVSVEASRGHQGGEPRASGLLELELQMILSCMWMLGTKCGFFASSVNALNL